MLQSFVIYGGLILLMFFLNIKYVLVQDYSDNYNNYKSSFLHPGVIISLFAFAIICGLRYMVGVDYSTYYNIFSGMKAHPYSDTYPDLEYGFYLLLKGLAKINAPHSWMFGILAFFQIFFIYFAFKTQRFLYPFLGFVIITGGFYFMMMNGIRQSIAWCILIAAIPYSNTKGTIKFFLLNILALFFHKSAILFIPIFFISFYEKDMFQSIILQLGLLGGVMLFAETSFLNNLNDQIQFLTKLIGYEEKYGNIDEILTRYDGNFTKGARYFGAFVIYVVIIIYSKKMKSFYSTKLFIKYYNLFFIGALSFFITYQNSLLQRPALYFMVMQIPISAYLFHYLWKKANKTLIDLLVLWGTIMIHLLIFFAFIRSNHFTQYLFYWEKLFFIE